MDVLKKELEAAFSIQSFDKSLIDRQVLLECQKLAKSLTLVNNGCAVLSDMAANKSYFTIGSFGDLLGLSPEDISQEMIDSLDEDCIYTRIHPEDLVDKRMLELKFFFFLCEKPIEERLKYRSSCRIRIQDRSGTYRYVANKTQILRNSPCGNMWLALCQYDLSSDQTPMVSINSLVTNIETGDVFPINLYEERKNILSDREKEILILIKEGLLSKEISFRLGITIHTVNRHRQNIINRLSVGNSFEAVRAAEMMKLF